MGLTEPLQVHQDDQSRLPPSHIASLACVCVMAACPLHPSEVLLLYRRYTHTHTRSYGAGQIRWRMNMKMKGWPTHPNKRTTGKEPKTTKEGHQQQQGRGRRQEARGGGENSTKQHNKKNRERLSVGTGFVPFDEQQHTAHKHKRRRGTQQGREGHKHTPDPGNNQGQPWKGRKKQKANTPEGRPTEAATVGRGTNNPLKAWKRHQRPNTTKPTWGRNGPT